MGVNLTKGANVNLTKAAPGLNKVIIGLGWDARASDGAAFDLDGSAFLLDAAGKVRSDADFIFFNNKTSACKSVEHGGDNTTGKGDGDDEQVNVTLSSVPADVQRVSFAVTVHEADTRRQNFGMVSSAFIRVVDAATGTEISRYDLSEDASTDTAMTFGELYKHNGEWKFKAIGQGFKGGLGVLAASFGVNV